MSLFRKIFLCFALLLTIVGNSATLGFCLCDNELIFSETHECGAKTHDSAPANACACAGHSAKCADAEKTDSAPPCKTLLLELDDDFAPEAQPPAVPPPLPCELFFSDFLETFRAICALMQEHSSRAGRIIESVRPPPSVLAEIALPLLA